MKPLFTPTKFEDAKSRDLLPLECYICHVTFTALKNEIQKSLKRQLENNPRRNEHKYCSTKCSHVGKHNGKNIACFLCGKIVYRTPKDIRKTKYSFCSTSCSAKYHNAHKTTGCRRSKLERWIEQQLAVKYPLLKIDYNKTNAINFELDIYIPQLKLAFELNGIFHYEEIYGKLDKIKNTDSQKYQKCIQNEISLCVIDTYFNRKNLLQKQVQCF